MTDYERRIALDCKDFERNLTDEDVVVVPAIHAGRIGSIPGRRKVIIVQNGGLLFNSLPLESRTRYPWHHPGTEGIICVSDHDFRLIELASPSCPIYRVYNSVDPERFAPLVPWQKRKNLVLASPLLPYKNPWHTTTVCHAVRSRWIARGEKDNLSIRIIQNLTPRKVEELLGQSKVLVFLSMVEGFGLLPMEAILAGTPVVCYRGQAYQEFIPDLYLHEVSDFAGMVQTIERILALEPDDPWHKVRETAYQNCCAYSVVQQKKSVLETWSRILE